MFQRHVALSDKLYKLLAICFVICIPIIIVSATVLIAFNTDSVYTRGFEKYSISQKTGISSSELLNISKDLQKYFNNDKELLDTKAVIYGQNQDLFNEREIHHMRDVKSLVKGTYWIFITALVYICLFTVARIIAGNIIPRISKLILYGSLSTIGIICLFGLLAILEFEALFLLFHQISFSNDLWQLDPRKDYLVILFPTGFWLDATLLITITAICVAGITSTFSAGILIYIRLKDTRKQDHISSD